MRIVQEGEPWRRPVPVKYAPNTTGHLTNGGALQWGIRKKLCATCGKEISGVPNIRRCPPCSQAHTIELKRGAAQRQYERKKAARRAA